MKYEEKIIPEQIGHKGGCVARAITFATGLPFKEVYATLEVLGQLEGTENAPLRGRYRRSHPSRGMKPDTHRRYLASLEWEYVTVPPYMILDLMPHIGTIIIHFKGHLACAIDGIIYDSWDSRKKQIRGYFRKRKDN
jgi:hypothetical protein